MTPLSIQVPFPVFQGRDGQPLENGYIWIGEPNLNPQTNPVVAYYDAALTIVAPQPLRTLNGYVSRAGTPAQIYVDGANFSILVQDSKGSMVYNFPNGTGIGADACGITYNPPFAGAVAIPVCEKLAETISVKDFGAVGDGVTDDTAALIAAAAALQDGQTLDFVEGTYLVSYQGAPYSSVYGNVVMEFDGLSDVTFNGDGATIKIVDHNITTNGGLRFMNFIGCKRIAVTGFNFDMTFVGTNTSGSFYPFCGAITVLDEDSATPAFSTLNSDFIFYDLKFKLFHPYGNWATTSSPFAGDPNNGYKLFSIFTSGPYTPTSYDNQCRNIAVRNCTFLKGHNGYGIWFWAWNNCEVTGCVAEAWVSKHSNSSGTYVGGGVSMIRHIPFRTEGIVIEGNEFRSMPTAERVSGFEGLSVFYIHANNMGSIDWGKGLSIVSNNNIILGTGSISGGSGSDAAVFFNGFGQLIVSNNNIDGHDGQDPAVGTGVYALELPMGSGGQDNGAAEITITGNNFGPWNFGGIYLTTGSATSAARRRCKSLVVTNNSFNTGDYFLRMAGFGALTYEGVQSAVITGNLIQSLNTPTFPPPSVNNYGIFVAATEATDSVIISNNVIRDKTYSIQTNPSYVSASAQVRRFDNQLTNNTNNSIAGDRFPFDQTIAVIVQALSDSATYQPYVKCTNTESTLAEIYFYQQTTSSYIIATNDIQAYTDGAAQTVTDSNVFRPAADNTKTLGSALFRWSEVFAGNGTINTSDERAKEQIQDIDAAVLRAWGKVNYAQFKFKDAVQLKGDNARWHFGLIAQRVKEAFESEGLDAFEYGLLCHDQWEDQYEDVLVEVDVQNSDGSISKVLQGNGEKRIVVPAGDRYGIRYDEALALECAYLRNKLGV